jgi:hypothetical protein
MVGFTIITMAINAIAAVLCYMSAYKEHLYRDKFPWLWHILGGANIFCLVFNAFRLVDMLW